MRRVSFAMLAGLLLAASVSFAQPDTSSSSSPRGTGGPQGHPGPPSPADHVKMLDKELNLTADQKTKITQILEDQQAQMKKMREDTSTPRDQKMAMMKEQHQAVHSKIRALLDPDQQKKFDEAMKRMQQEHMGHGMGDGHGQGQGQGQEPPPPPPQ